MRPVAGQLVAGGIHKAFVLRAGDRTHTQLESVNEDRMRRALVFVAELSAHGEPAASDRRKSWREDRRARINHRAIIRRDRRRRIIASTIDHHSRETTMRTIAPA